MELDYFNARVRGMKGRLLAGADYEVLMRAPDAASVREVLSSTPVGPSISIAGARLAADARVVEEALRIELSTTLDFLWKTAPTGARPLVKALIAVWEVHDLKTVARAVAKGAGRDEARALLLSAGEFTRAALEELLTSRDLAEVLGYLESWGSDYAASFRRGHERFSESGHLIEIEIELDRYVLDPTRPDLAGRTSDRHLIRRTLAYRTDVANTMTLFKIAGQGYTPEGAASFFIEGGERLPRHLFERLSQTELKEEIAGGLSGEIKDRDFAAAISAYDPEYTGLLEENLNYILERRLWKKSITEPHGIATAAAYLMMKVREIKNLRLIVRARVFGMPDTELRRFLYYRH